MKAKVNPIFNIIKEYMYMHLYSIFINPIFDKHASLNLKKKVVYLLINDVELFLM